MKHSLMVAAVLVVLATVGLSGQQRAGDEDDTTGKSRPSSFSFLVNPGLEIPFGESSQYFSLGGSLELGGEYFFTAKPAWFASAGLGYQLAPIQAEKSVQLLSAGIGGGVSFEIVPRLSVKAFADGGLFFGFLPTESGPENGWNPYLKAGCGLSYLMSPRINLGVSAAYRYLIGLYNGLGVNVGTSIYFSGVESREARIRSLLPVTPGRLPGVKVPGSGEGIRINSVDFVPIFPVFHTFYDDHPIGWIDLLNQEKEPVRNLKVSLYVRKHMDTPKICAEIAELRGGEQKEIELNALFTDSILSVTEGTKVAAEITLEYQMHGDAYQSIHSETIRLYDRNAITWDDDRKACAFVTAKDPAVLSFAKNVVGSIRGATNATLSEELLKALALHEALNLYGVSYVVDPQTPYAKLSQDKHSVDFLQFPRQTMEYKAGDCDDLSILYCALLEAVGVETAFITVPGHILMAFALRLEPAKVARSFQQADDLITVNNAVWLPVEVTERGGFLRAWQAGAQQWRQHAAAGQARFYPMHAGWQMYEPVALPGEPQTLSIPTAERVVQAFQQELSRFINREIRPQVASLEGKIKSGGGSAELHNRLGVVYARYGLLEEAENVFRQALKKEEFAPALVNLGNIQYLKGEWEGALKFYERASRKAPDDPLVLLPIARVYHQLEKYDLARGAFSKLKKTDPQLADRYAYLDQRGDDTARAADLAQMEGVVEWSDE